MNDLQKLDKHLAAVRDHTRHFNDFSFVYPVISRRSRGLSLGINVNPNKICNFNCIYCEVDRLTPPKASHLDVRRMREELTALIHLVRQGGLKSEGRFRDRSDLTREIRDIAFSGDGEPTMIHNFVEAVQCVADIKKAEGLDQTKIVLITDAAGLDKADVRRGLEILDANQGEIWGKLDAGTETYFRLVNRSFIRFDRIISNLLNTSRLRPIVIQSLFLKVHGEIMPPSELDSYCGRVNNIVKEGGLIKEVHAYTVARPTPEPYATKLDSIELEGLAETIRKKTTLPVTTFE